MRPLAEIAHGSLARVIAVDGARGFRRRLMEMGLVPGTEVKIIDIAPFGDPMRIEVRRGQWSIRRDEARQVTVELVPVTESATVLAAATAVTESVGSAG